MKWFLLMSIQLYWFLVPPIKRRQCLFKKSCSHFVFEAAHENGLTAGLRALRYRFKRCHAGSAVYVDPNSGKATMVLVNNDLINHDEISYRVLRNYSGVEQS